MDNPVIIFGVSLLLAAAIEGGVEYIFGTIADKVAKLTPYKWLLMYIGLAAGVGLAIFYKIDFVSVVMQGDSSMVGYVLTGTLIGRGSNYINDFWQKYLVQK